ncbi:LysR family transcriptional regulator [Salmonella enterica subsp. enterica serovar Typhimurium]|nr:LysR family transcriptional regulator [Salmonella enterica subsp. enterica serovar Typhimurium]
MANLYDLKKFDLNLLVIFECIYQHLSISKAAETLYITPSAVSQSLQRLAHAIQRPSIYSFRQRNYAYRNRH